jgi:hypothetical protein
MSLTNVRRRPGEIRKKANKQDLQHLYQQGGQEGRYLILNQEKEERKGHSHQIQQAIQQGKGSQMNLGAKRDYFNYEKHQESLDP